MLPLGGMTVVSVEQAVAAPFATRHLADIGARVIKIEQPEVGDFARHYDEKVGGLSSHFVWLNRSKESLALDLKQDETREILRRLIARADVFVQNLAPGAAGRLGLGADELRAQRPGLVYCGISGYGEGGPYTSKKAYDLLVQCEAGLVAITGTPETPSKVGISVADIAAGMYAYSGILSALLRRERTGEGATLEVSMLEALGEWMGFPAYFAGYGGEEPRRSGASHTAIAPYGPFECGDGQTVFLGIQNEREWKKFCDEVLEREGLAGDNRFYTNSRRVENRDELHAEIERVFISLSSEEAIDRLEGAGVANARMRSIRQFLDHPQLEARDRWREFGSPVGPLRGLLPPAMLDGQEPVMAPIPEVGEHNEKILAELGYEDVQTTTPGHDVGEGGMMTGDDHHATRGGQMVWRSLLSVPGSNLRMVEKAFASDADAVILDLEDAVAPDAKAEARRNVVRALEEFDRGGKATLCRVNALDTPYFYSDLIEVVEGSGENLDAVVIPKVERPEDLYAVAVLLNQIELATGLERGRIEIEVQVESAGGLVNVDATVRASDRLGGLHFGPGDYAASVRMPYRSIGTMDEWDEVYPGHRFHYAMHRVVVAARTVGVRAVDGPVADHRDEEGLRKSCLLARSLGFDGKWCIHPAQIAIVNYHFSPTEKEVEWAKKVVAAYEEANAAGSGAISVEGQMVDAASIRMARNTLDVARR